MKIKYRSREDITDEGRRPGQPPCTSSGTAQAQTDDLSRTLLIFHREHVSYVSPQVEGHEWTPAVGKLDEPKHTADPVHLMRVFGISAGTAMKYV